MNNFIIVYINFPSLLFYSISDKLITIMKKVVSFNLLKISKIINFIN